MSPEISTAVVSPSCAAKTPEKTLPSSRRRSNKGREMFCVSPRTMTCSSRTSSLGPVHREPPDQHGIDEAEDRRIRTDAERQRERRREGEPRPAPRQPPRVAQVLPHVAEHVSTGSARRDGRRRARLFERRHGLAEQVLVAELGQGQTRRLVLRCPARPQLPPAILEMLRELVDDLRLAGRRETQRRQPRAHVPRPIRHVRLP